MIDSADSRIQSSVMDPTPGRLFTEPSSTQLLKVAGASRIPTVYALLAAAWMTGCTETSGDLPAVQPSASISPGAPSVTDKTSNPSNSVPSNSPASGTSNDSATPTATAEALPSSRTQSTTQPPAPSQTSAPVAATSVATQSDAGATAPSTSATAETDERPDAGAAFDDVTSTGPTLAFPGAQGFGRNATGGRQGTVYHVTNLNDSGPGSFRDAVSASNRIVVFDVGGYVQLKTAVSAKSNLTIAGQTAPGGGIGFRGGEISFANQSNVICRHLRIRPGSETESDKDDALSLYLASNVIIDHTSLEFGPWNNIDGVGTTDDPVTDITFQDSLIADPTGQQFGAHTESVGGHWSWYRNVFANSHNRNPLAKVNNVFVNNLLYNCSAGYTTHTSTPFQHDIINNYFVFGPASTGTDNAWYQIDKNQSIYYSGNLKDSNLNGVLDGQTTTPYWYQGEGKVLDAPWTESGGAAPGIATTPEPLDAASAALAAISRAGALPQDAIDQLIVSQILTLGQGAVGMGAGSAGPDGSLYTSQAQTGLGGNGYGEIASGSPEPDLDGDGISDAWERATGSDPTKDDAMNQASDGYALIEHYINWLAEPHAITTTDQSVNVDLAALTLGFGTTATYDVSDAHNGSVDLGTDGRTAVYQPAPGYVGVGSFAFRVEGADGTALTSRVRVLIAP